jgi:hypothetical protein
MGVITLLLTTLSISSSLPSLQLIYTRRRHFEIFISILQLFSSLSRDISEAVGCNILGITSNQYHHVSDIATETYVCLILIHLSGYKSEDTLHLVRYTAFGLCWFAKLGDGWSSILLEAIVIIMFAMPPLCLLLFSFKKKERITPGQSHKASFIQASKVDATISFLTRKLPYNKAVAEKAMACVAGGLILLVLENKVDTPFKLLHAGAQVMFGAATYYLWGLLPCLDKDDNLPSFR